MTKLRVKKAALRKGTTLKEVSDKLGLNYVAFCKTLRSNPTLSTLEKTAEAIGVSVNELIEGDSFLAVVINGDEAKVFRSKEELKEFLG